MCIIDTLNSRPFYNQVVMHDVSIFTKMEAFISQITPYIIFTPVGMTANTSLIIYPGGRVDPRSYAPAARNISMAGFLVIITPMPLNLAVFAPDKAKEVMARYPAITKWVIGGHSLGGSMAAQFASQNPTMLTGLVLWASYPAGNISTMPVKVLSISGSRDGLSTPDKIAASRANLPPSTKFVEIQGGNHGQFGWYGDQFGDNAATITRVEQQAIIVNETLNFLTNL